MTCTTGTKDKVAHVELKVVWNREPFSLVGRTGVPSTEALSSLQPRPRLDSRPGAPRCVSLSFSLILFPVRS